MNWTVLINVFIFIILLGVLYRMQKTYVSFNKRVFTAFLIGVVFGGALQWVYGVGSASITQTNEWVNLVGSGYVQLLRMVVMPLIAVSILAAIINLKDVSNLGKNGGTILVVLLGTTAIAAAVGIIFALGFGLSAEGMQQAAGASELAQIEKLKGMAGSAQQITIPRMLLDSIPANPFLDLTGARKTSTIGVVIFFALLGIAALGIAEKKPQSVETFRGMVNSIRDVVLRLVALVLRLTPYGVMALMAKMMSTSNWKEILNLAEFVVASYLAIGAMFLIHFLLLGLNGLNPWIFLKKSLPTLVFAFTSRSSAGTIPLTVETQTKKLGVPEATANLAASFGATIGQNGCAGIYPAMLAVMAAPLVGVNPLDPAFIGSLIFVVMISSFGVAGVGGGATFSALIVLSAMNLPVFLAGLLISIEPLIDMARTALNVNDSLLAGTLAAKRSGDLDKDLYKMEISDEPSDL